MKKIACFCVFLALVFSSCQINNQEEPQKEDIDPLNGIWEYVDGEHTYSLTFALSGNFAWRSPVMMQDGSYYCADDIIYFDTKSPDDRAGISSATYKIYDANKLYCDAYFIPLNVKQQMFTKKVLTIN
jgi:hypothetical protein